MFELGRRDEAYLARLQLIGVLLIGPGLSAWCAASAGYDLWQGNAESLSQALAPYFNTLLIANFLCLAGGVLLWEYLRKDRQWLTLTFDSEAEVWTWVAPDGKIKRSSTDPRWQWEKSSTGSPRSFR